MTTLCFDLLLQLAQLCQKEMRKEAQRSQKVTQQTVPKARRLSREVSICVIYHFKSQLLNANSSPSSKHLSCCLCFKDIKELAWRGLLVLVDMCMWCFLFCQMLVYWKKYEKVEKEHRKRAEKEAMEQRKLDDEFREVKNCYCIIQCMQSAATTTWLFKLYLHVTQWPIPSMRHACKESWELNSINTSKTWQHWIQLPWFPASASHRGNRAFPKLLFTGTYHTILFANGERYLGGNTIIAMAYHQGKRTYFTAIVQSGKLICHFRLVF